MSTPVYPNTISLSNLSTETGGASTGPNVALNNYYAGGSIVPGGAYASPGGTPTYIPSSGALSLNSFHGYSGARITGAPTFATLSQVGGISTNLTGIAVSPSGFFMAVGTTYYYDSTSPFTNHYLPYYWTSSGGTSFSSATQIPGTADPDGPCVVTYSATVGSGGTPGFMVVGITEYTTSGQTGYGMWYAIYTIGSSSWTTSRTTITAPLGYGFGGGSYVTDGGPVIAVNSAGAIFVKCISQNGYLSYVVYSGGSWTVGNALTSYAAHSFTSGNSNSSFPVIALPNGNFLFTYGGNTSAGPVSYIYNTSSGVSGPTTIFPSGVTAYTLPTGMVYLPVSNKILLVAYNAPSSGSTYGTSIYTTYDCASNTWSSSAPQTALTSGVGAIKNLTSMANGLVVALTDVLGPTGPFYVRPPSYMTYNASANTWSAIQYTSIGSTGNGLNNYSSGIAAIPASGTSSSGGSYKFVFLGFGVSVSSVPNQPFIVYSTP